MPYKDKEKARAYRREWNKKRRAEHKDYFKEWRRKQKELILPCKWDMKLIWIYSDGIKYGYAVFQWEWKIKVEEYLVKWTFTWWISFEPTLKSYTLESDEMNLWEVEIKNIQEFCNSVKKQ